MSLYIQCCVLTTNHCTPLRLSNRSAALYSTFGHVHLLFWLFNDTLSPENRISCDAAESSYFHGGRKTLSDLAADFLQTFLSPVWVPTLTLQEVEASQWDCQVFFFLVLIPTKFIIQAIIESLEKGMGKIWQCKGGCGQDMRLMGYHMLPCLFVLLPLTK